MGHCGMRTKFWQLSAFREHGVYWLTQALCSHCIFLVLELKPQPSYSWSLVDMWAAIGYQHPSWLCLYPSKQGVTLPRYLERPLITTQTRSIFLHVHLACQRVRSHDNFTFSRLRVEPSALFILGKNPATALYLLTSGFHCLFWDVPS